ncbi:DUF485 domain-containing protein [Kitasatospora sp. GP82]|uniref:DUF485 domain-containing protein n=1 Tax=Kitasatospora sp. GP82 TaxID=3035089 RepID=UPI0024766F79|nr:DUF485 domain-containing protein [Kitasatospora sp. GP82]MDH6127762.1 uncharacterized membrane protein (DUF485 family) [Kitasatospora sp. GP82]
MAQQERFDWWAAQPAGRKAVRRSPVRRLTLRRPAAVASVESAVESSPSESAPVASVSTMSAADTAEVYRSVQGSAAFQDIRRGYRGFVFPATAAFLAWYLLYLTAQAAAPGLMRAQVVGPLNVAWLLGLLQFASTFVLTWLYARNARGKRDRAALSLRWDTQDQLR